MFSPFKKQPVEITPYRCDFGSKLLPEADNGPSSMAEALAMLRQMQIMGITQCITAVTIGSHNAKTHTPQAISGWLHRLRAEAEKAGIGIQLDVAGRYLLDNEFEALLTSRTLLPLPGNRLLLDNSPGLHGSAMHKLLFQLQMAGYKPVMAQVELYPRD
ncbi:MAG: CpsB/CapC family capsule biosynthesis tyrosine phosphatase, partial [Bacteroidales bacterium]